MLVVAMLAWGCGKKDSCDPITESCEDEDQAYTGPWEVDGLGWDCGEEGYTFDVSTAGVPETVLLDVQRTGEGEGDRIAEFHTLYLTDASPDGYWSTWTRPLALEDLAADWVSDANTLFTCDDSELLSLRVTLIDYDGAEVGCWQAGHDAVYDPCTWLDGP